MAVRFDAPEDRLTELTGTWPSPNAGFTVTAWVRIVVDTGTYATWFRAFTPGRGVVLNGCTEADGTTGGNYFTLNQSAANGVDMQVGTWYPIALSHENGTNTGTSYLRDGATTLADAATVDDGIDAAGICIGGRDDTDPAEFWNGEIAYVRIWSAELSQDEIEAEWESATPVRTDDLLADWPLVDETDLTDTVQGLVLAVQGGGVLDPAAQPTPLTAATGLAAGTYFAPVSPAQADTSGSLGNEVLHLTPWRLVQPISIDRLAVNIALDGEAGCTVRPGVYVDTGNYAPGMLLVDGGTLAADAIASPEATVAADLDAGLYWVGGVVQAAPTTEPEVTVTAAAELDAPVGSVTLADVAGAAVAGYSQSGVSGALPDPFVADGVSTAAPRVIVRLA